MVEKDTDNNVQDQLRQLSVKDFLDMGVDQIAYIKPVLMDSKHAAYAIHAANGRQISTIDSYPSAIALVQKNDMHPVTVH